MDATSRLRDEHGAICAALERFEVLLRRGRRRGRLRRNQLDPLVEFFAGFVDACHYCKEEDALFAALEKAGVPGQGGPMNVMRREHGECRRCVSAIRDSLPAADRGEADATRTVLEQGQALIGLLRRHIEKVDHCLFGMASELVRGDDLAALLKTYDEIDRRADRDRALAPYRTQGAPLPPGPAGRSGPASG